MDRTDQTLGVENNIGEKKINELLFAPLYTINHPNYLIENNKNAGITPILLSKSPEWQGEGKANLLFTLKDSIKWSDGSAITTDDVQYTFERLKEATGSPKFKSTVSKLTFQKVDDQKFLIKSSEDNAKMLYKLNFQPIPKDYFEYANNTGLIANKKSAKPMVSSGLFKFEEGKVDNPDTKKSEEVDNPIKINDENRTVALTKNNYNNYPNNLNNIKTDKYYLKKYDTKEISTDENIISIQNGILNSEVDIFTNEITLGEDQEFNLSQGRQATNTYISMYMNMQSNATGFLVNKSLRKYITCNMSKFADEQLSTKYNRVSNNRIVTPLELGVESALECPEDINTVLDSEFYTIAQDENSKQILLSDLPLELNIVTFEDNLDIADSLENYFKTTVGIPLNIIFETDEVINRLSKRDYHIALLPNTITSRDIFDTFHSTAQNLSAINLNNKKEVEDLNFNETLQKYSESDLQDQASKTKIVEFFEDQNILINLYQKTKQINYSDKLIDFEQNISEDIASNDQNFYAKAKWYTDTKRVFRLNNKKEE